MRENLEKHKTKHSTTRSLNIRIKQKGNTDFKFPLPHTMNTAVNLDCDFAVIRLKLLRLSSMISLRDWLRPYRSNQWRIHGRLVGVQTPHHDRTDENFQPRI
jgi:hypothetical protein